jgi:hypothetical protein
MRKLVLIGIVAVALAGCTSLQEGAHYADVAGQHTFGYYFPSAASTRSFSTLEEAYDFTYSAQIKLRTSINRRAAKGLAARLLGPAVIQEKPVVVGNFLVATTTHTRIDLSNAGDSLETALREAISVSCVFMVFYEDRAASLSSFYLRDGYAYTSNSQYSGFTFGGNSYNAEYPAGWGIEKAFQYLRKELD